MARCASTSEVYHSSLSRCFCTESSTEETGDEKQKRSEDPVPYPWSSGKESFAKTSGMRTENTSEKNTTCVYIICLVFTLCWAITPRDVSVADFLCFFSSFFSSRLCGEVTEFDVECHPLRLKKRASGSSPQMLQQRNQWSFVTAPGPPLTSYCSVRISAR